MRREPAGTKRDQIVDELRRRIASGTLPRGERLRQDALAEEFGTSITPVREALSVLVADGLVVAEPHRGVRVASVDLGRVTQTYVLRRLAEPYATERAALRMSALDLREAERVLDELESAAAQGLDAEVRRLNRAFHFAFYDRCGIAGLAQHVATLWEAFPWDLMLTSPGRTDAAQREHREIVAAVRGDDAGRAAELVGLHIREGFLAVTAALGGDASVDPFDPAAPLM